MAKIVRKIPLFIRDLRRRDNNIKREMEQRLSKNYPSCIGNFNECSDLKAGEIIEDCKSCPHFSKENYLLERNKLNCEVESMKKTTKKEEKPKKIEKEKAKKKVDKDKIQQERINKLLEMENAGTLKGANKAWLTMYRNKGLA